MHESNCIIGAYSGPTKGILEKSRKSPFTIVLLQKSRNIPTLTLNREVPYNRMTGTIGTNWFAMQNLDLIPLPPLILSLRKTYPPPSPPPPTNFTKMAARHCWR